MNINFTFIFNGEIQIGVGARQNLINYLKSKSFRSIALIVDKNLSDIEKIRIADENIGGLMVFRPCHRIEGNIFTATKDINPDNSRNKLTYYFGYT